MFCTARIFLLIIVFSANCAFAQSPSLDSELASIIRVFGLTRPQPPQVDPIKARLGQMLFNDPKLSGNRNISCSTCHDPRLGSSDAMPFSIGEGGQGLGRARSRNGARITRRNSPALYNLSGLNRNQFWDGRVEFENGAHTFVTPEPKLNGARPVALEIVRSLSGSLAAQALFPMTDPSEMLGLPGTNEIASAKGRISQWQKIVDRLVAPGALYTQNGLYAEMFAKAFPEVQRSGRVNIGHVGSAIQEFIQSFFYSGHTRYDAYLNGQRHALNDLQKQGMVVFFKQGFCGSCHFGPNLSNQRFFNVGTPQIFLPSHENQLDLGRFELTKFSEDYNTFKTPGLRNLRFSAPYMHNGSLQTMRQVIDHYDNVGRSVANYNVPIDYIRFYQENFTVDRDAARNMRRFEGMKLPQLKNGLHLTEHQKKALESFLMEGLSD